MPTVISTDYFENYWHNASVVNNALSALATRQLTRDQVEKRMADITSGDTTIETNAVKMEAGILEILNNLGPIVSIGNNHLLIAA